MRVRVEKAAEGVQARLGGQALAVPEPLAGSWPKRVVVHFGRRRAVAEVSELPQEVEVSGTGEWRVEAGSELIGQLLLQPGLSYRVEYREGEVWIGPVIGLLLGEQKYVYHDINMGEFTDAMAFYGQTGGLVTAFKLSSIDWKQECVYGLFFDASKKRWAYGVFPLPSVVYLRAFNLDEAELNRLKAATGGLVFNSVRYDKWELYRLLQDDPVLKQHLPKTDVASYLEVVAGYLTRFGRVILKPRGLSRARGILILEEIKDGYVHVIDYTSGKGKTMYVVPDVELFDLLLRKHVLTGAYIVQPRLDLATINGSPFDIRVVMQKNEKQVWQCTGIECRHAATSDWITNISRGGQALEIQNAARLSFGKGVDAEQFEQRVLALSHRFVEVMEGLGEHFAEFGLDVAADSKQNLWLIEANVRPTFNGFRKLDEAVYQKICGTPLLYAAGLAHAKRWGV